MAVGRVAAKKAKTSPRVSQRECQLALQKLQFLGSEALRPVPQEHNAKPNTQPRPGPMGRLAFLQGIPDWAPRATRVGGAAGLGIRPTTKKKGRGRGCAWSGPNAGVWARPSGLEYLFVRRPRRRRAGKGERDKGNRDRSRRCRADAPTAARRCLAASAPRLLCCRDQITSFGGGSKAHAFTAKAKNVSAMSGEVTAKLPTCQAGKPTDFCFECRVPPRQHGCCSQASTRDGARPRLVLDQDLPRSSAATATGHTARHVDGRDI